jgi:hypothetical protein
MARNGERVLNGDLQNIRRRVQRARRENEINQPQGGT